MSDTQADGAVQPGPDAAADDATALRRILARIPDPSRGLPNAVFEFALQVTPMINVDLLVVDGEGRALLAWREDAYGTGWHVPGGIIRVNELVQARIAATARAELGVDVVSEPSPIAISQLFGGRGHFISMLFRCRLAKALPPERLGGEGPPRDGDLAWFSAAPEDRYPAHDIYIRRLPVFAGAEPLGLGEEIFDNRKREPSRRAGSDGSQ